MGRSDDESATASRDEEHRLRAMLEAMHDVVLVVDSSGRYLEIGPSRPELLYRPRPELLGKSVREVFSPEHAALFEGAIGEVCRTGRPVTIGYALPIGGRDMWFEARLSPMSAHDAAEPSVVVVARDVTEQHHLEERLRQAQKMEAVGQLAGGIAHDFNNVLTAIIGHSAFLLGALPKDDPSWSEVAAIRDAANRAATLTRQLLAFGRRQVLDLRVVSLRTVLDGLEMTLRRMLGDDVDLRVAHAPDAGNVRIDVAQMEQVVLNLALNAREAMRRGGRLRIETANVELGGDGDDAHPEPAAGSFVLLSVDDDGGGMAPDVLSRAFEPFFSTKEGGTGLGLAMVYGIIRQFGGRARIQSEVGRGTTVRLFLPRVSEDVEAAAAAATTTGNGELPTGDETVLVVEDNDMVRGLAVRILRVHGYSVLEARSASVAVELAAQHAGDIQLLLTDVVMPVTSGRDLAAALRAVRPSLLVLYMSGYTANIIAHHGVLEPATPFLQKPFTPAALASKVRSVLDGR